MSEQRLWKIRYVNKEESSDGMFRQQTEDLQIIADDAQKMWEELGRRFFEKFNNGALNLILEKPIIIVTVP